MTYEIYENTIIEKFINGKSEISLQIGITEDREKETFYYFAMFRFSYEGKKIGYFSTRLEGDTLQYVDMAYEKLERDYQELKKEAVARYNKLHQEFPLNL